jgi:hypothetical protein
MKSQPIEAPVRVFGTWDAPVTDDAKRIDVPVARLCMHCRETFRDGDNGAIMPNGFAQHRECALRVALGGIGHHVDHAFYCASESGPDAGLTYRQSALLVWRVFVDHKPVSRDALERLRAAPPNGT